MMPIRDVLFDIDNGWCMIVIVQTRRLCNRFHSKGIACCFAVCWVVYGCSWEVQGVIPRSELGAKEM